MKRLETVVDFESVWMNGNISLGQKMRTLPVFYVLACFGWAKNPLADTGKPSWEKDVCWLGAKHNYWQHQ